VTLATEHAPNGLVTGLPSDHVELTPGSLRQPHDRLYRASCPHASWWIMVAIEHAEHPLLPVQCPGGCGLVWASSIEPPP
jgi:hypothetical protein